MEYIYSEKFEQLFEHCVKLTRDKKRAVIAIDGRAASGKSTLAADLARYIGGVVVHADDFFLPFDKRTDERLSEPGGNIHYERFRAEVIDHLGESFDYGVFNCSEGRVTEQRHIPADCPLIIEGAYSSSPVFGRYYDLSVFVTASYEIRISRIRERNGDIKAEMFKKRWIPLEEVYFETFRIEDAADMIIDTTDV